MSRVHFSMNIAIFWLVASFYLYFEKIISNPGWSHHFGVCQPPPPLLRPRPKLNKVSRVHYSMNIADFLASCLIWPIFSENYSEPRLLTSLGSVSVPTAPLLIKRPPLGWTQNSKQKNTMPHLIIDPKYCLQYMPNNETDQKNQHY